MIIRPFEPDDIDEVLSIEQLCFNRSDSYYRQNEDYLRRFYTTETTFVSTIKRNVIGFGTHTFPDSDPMIRFYVKRTNDYITSDFYTIEREIKGDLYAYSRGDGPDCKVFYEQFPNEFNDKRYKIKEKDVQLAMMCVHPEYRRHGIGKALVKKRLESAKEQGSIAAFVNCWDVSPSQYLYEALGFLRIAHFGPAWADGSGTIVMGAFLEKLL